MALRTAANITATRTRAERRRLAEQPGEPFPLGRRQRAQLPFPQEMQRTTMVALVALLTLAALAIDLQVTHGLSVDEILAVDQAETSLGGLIRELAHGVKPPLHPVLVWVAVHLLGSGDFAVRLPSLLAGVALVPATAALARELFDRRTAVLAALLAALAPIVVWYSQEVSPYELVALFGALTVLGAVRARRRGAPEDWALHTVAAALAVWSSWSGIFIVVASELILLERLIPVASAGPDGAERRRLLLAWGLDTLGLAIQFLALGWLLSDQLSAAGSLAGLASVGASGPSFYTAVSNVSWALFGFHPAAVTDALSAVWPLGMLASLLMIGRRLSPRTWLLLVCVLIPALGTLLLGLWVPAAFDVRYALAGVPAGVVLVARIITGVGPGRLPRLAAALAACLIFAAALVDQQLDRANPRRYDYRPALAQVQRGAGPSTAVFYAPPELRVVLARDAAGLRARPLGRRLPTRAQAREVVLLSSFTGRPSVRALLNRDLGALRATRRLVGYRSYPGVDVWWFR